MRISLFFFSCVSPLQRRSAASLLCCDCAFSIFLLPLVASVFTSTHICMNPMHFPRNGEAECDNAALCRGRKGNVIAADTHTHTHMLIKNSRCVYERVRLSASGLSPTFIIAIMALSFPSFFLFVVILDRPSAPYTKQCCTSFFYRASLLICTHPVSPTLFQGLFFFTLFLSPLCCSSSAPVWHICRSLVRWLACLSYTHTRTPR